MHFIGRINGETTTLISLGSGSKPQLENVSPLGWHFPILSSLFLLSISFSFLLSPSLSFLTSLLSSLPPTLLTLSSFNPFSYPFHPPSPLIDIIKILHCDENIHPVRIEKRIKSEIPFLSNVMVVGNKREYLTCLMTLKVYLYPPLHLHPPWNSIYTSYNIMLMPHQKPLCLEFLCLLLQFALAAKWLTSLDKTINN